MSCRRAVTSRWLRQHSRIPERRNILTASVLVVCPDRVGLTSLTRALSGSFAVLAANSAEQAVAKALDHADCRVALLALERGPRAFAALAAALKTARPALTTVGLARRPLVPELREAAACGRLDAVYALPQTPEELQAHVQACLAPCAEACELQPMRSILTREEIAFLLGQQQPAACATPRSADPAGRRS